MIKLELNGFKKAIKLALNICNSHKWYTNPNLLGLIVETNENLTVYTATDEIVLSCLEFESDKINNDISTFIIPFNLLTGVESMLEPPTNAFIQVKFDESKTHLINGDQDISFATSKKEVIPDVSLLFNKQYDIKHRCNAEKFKRAINDIKSSETVRVTLEKDVLVLIPQFPKIIIDSLLSNSESTIENIPHSKIDKSYHNGLLFYLEPFSKALNNHNLSKKIELYFDLDNKEGKKPLKLISRDGTTRQTTFLSPMSDKEHE